MKKADLVTSIAHKHQLPRGKTQDVIEDLLEELAAALAKRIQSSPDRVQAVFQLCFNRTPDAREVVLAEKFLRTRSVDDLKLMPAFCQSLLASAEFRFVD